MNEGNHFDKHIQELMLVLKKLLKSQKIGKQDLAGYLDKKNVNLNLCFFNFLPMSEEDLADLEFELQEGGEDEPLSEENELKFELSKKDIEFLKKNGLAF